MTDLKALGARIDELEARLTFQDDTIETLNATITAQWLKIDALTRQVAALHDRLREAEASMPKPASEPPPHY
ncbi:MAG TPA: SlyX family protein [Bradyrhizobium sp.]|nr:SlyX family protein [Bradyrhizobium sp.]